MIDEITTTETQAAFDAGVIAGARTHEPVFTDDPHRVPFIIPPGWSLASFDRYRDIPERKKGRVHLFDASSFVAYTLRHETAGTTVYYDIEEGVFTAVLDDHEAGLPGWGDHRAIFAPKLTRSFQAWSAARRPMSQEKFGDLVESQISTIAEPSAATLLLMAEDFEVTSAGRFQKTAKRANGAKSIVYVEERDGKIGPARDVEIPETIIVQTPIFEGGQVFQFEGKIRYDITGGNLTIHVAFPTLDDTVDQAKAATLEAIREDLEGSTVLQGKPR